MNWQSIATAPKDGTVIDLWYAEYGRVTDQWYDAEDGWFTLDNPTHWMPSPDDPPSNGNCKNMAIKATRFNFYRDGMEPERSGAWVRVSQLPKHVQDEFVEPLVISEDVRLGDDNDDEEVLV